MTRSKLSKTLNGRSTPEHIRSSFQGTAAAFQSSLSNEIWLILAALVTVYIVLGVLYESYIHLSPFSRRCHRRAWEHSWRCSHMVISASSR